MNQPETKEIDLIKVRTIKKKHIEGLRGNHSIHWTQYEFLGYITEWDAMLLQHKETKHFALGQVVKYAEWFAETLKPEDYEIEEGIKPVPLDLIYRKAYETAHSLPQLFLD